MRRSFAPSRVPAGAIFRAAPSPRHVAVRPSLLPFAYSLPARLAASALPGCEARLPGARVVYLTFDDGPHPETTPHLLARLAAHDARASFFLLGDAASRQPGLVAAIRAGGHTVGQHGCGHRDAWRTDRATVLAGMERASGVLASITGEPVRWMRPPYGHLTPAMLRWARERRQRVALWDVMPGDFRRGASAERVAATVVRMVRPGSVVVLHEGPRAGTVSAAALDLLIPPLAARGFRFEALP
jgi:peptidoglycan-N-acetylglucosamine deacetylase